MAYSDDVVKSKLLALNETQESITAVAQWIMFHKRHADRTAQIWVQRMKESDPRKRLNLVYLANEVAQQSNMRKKMEFVTALSAVVSEGTVAAYKSAPQDIQNKLRRVIEVWRSRNVFDQQIQESIERGVDDVDKARGGGLKKSALGGSLFGSGPSAPTELQPLIPLQNNITKSEIAHQPLVSDSLAEYTKIADLNATDPVLSHRLASVVKSLANAESAVAESVKHRRALIASLEALLNTNKTALSTEEATFTMLTDRKSQMDSRRREVEKRIMDGLDVAPLAASYDNNVNEPRRPDVEEMTPPPTESLTPFGSPAPPQFTTTTGADVVSETQPSHPDRVPPSTLDVGASIPISQLSNPYGHSNALEGANGSAIANGIGSAGMGAGTLKRQASNDGPNGAAAKRRSMSSGKQTEEVVGIALDDDVAQMLG